MQTEKQQTEVQEILEEADRNGVQIGQLNGKVALGVALRTLAYRQSYNGQVEIFMNTFKQEVNQFPVPISSQIMKLRLALILEELAELAEGCGKEVASHFSVQLLNKSQEIHNKTEKSLVEGTSSLDIFDALLDIQYVVSGTVLAFGMQHIFEEGFEEVHRSNMSKACTSWMDAEETKARYELSGTECYIDKTDENKGIWLVKRTVDNKLLKSNRYSSADLSKILNKNGTDNIDI